MPKMHQQTKISLDEIRRVMITCKNCKSDNILDMSVEFDYSIERRQFTPFNCGVCGQGYDSALQSLNAFRNAYLALRKANQDIVGICFISDGEPA